VAVKKRLKKALIILGSILLFFILVLVTASLLFFYRKPLIKGLLEKQLTKRTGIQATIGTLDYELFPLRIEAGSITFSTKLEDTEVDVSVEKLTLRGDIHRIRKKQRPFLDIAEGKGVRIHANVKQTRKKIMIEDIIHGLSSSMSYVRQISLKNSFIDFIFSNQRIILQDVDFALSPSKGHESFAYELICRNAEVLIPTPKIGFQSMVQGSGTLSLKESPSIKGRFSLKANQFTYSERVASFEEIDLFFSSELQVDKNILIFPDLEIDIPPYVHLTCPLTVLFQDDITFYFHPRIQVDSLSNVFSLVKEYIPYPIDGLEMHGSVSIEGEGQIFPKRTTERVNLSGTVLLYPTHVKYKTSRFSLTNTLSGSLRLYGFPKNRDLSGRLKISNGSYSQKNLGLSGLDLEMPLNFSDRTSKAHLSPLNARFKTLTYSFQNREIKIDDAVFQGSGMLDLQRKSITLSQARIQFPPFPPFHITARAGLNVQATKSLSMKASDISLPLLQGFISPFLPKKVIDWEPDGVLSLQIEAHNAFQKDKEVWDVTTELETSGVQFHDPTFSLAGESLEPNLTLIGVFGRSLIDIPFSATFNLSHGESLWRDYYINWNKMPLQVKISGQLQVPQRKLAGLSVEAFIPDFIKIAAKGNFEFQESRSIDLSIIASELQLSSLYSFFLQRDTSGQVPISITGEAESSFDVEGSKNEISVKGYLEIRNASIAARDNNFSIKKIDATIPLNYRQNVNIKKTEASPPEMGFLSLGDIHLSDLDLFSLKLDVSSHQNRFTIAPFQIEIFGGKASIGKTSLELTPSLTSFRSLTSLSWKDVKLAQLPFPSKQHQLRGKLSVNLPRIEIQPDHITTEGDSEIEVFGGKITIKNIQVENLFSKYRAFSGDVRFADLNLQKITDLIPFGRVTGIINGEINDLIVSYGQPEHFILRLESNKRKGVRQKFSLKAANDLAILGTGEKTQFSPDSGWTRIVNSFNYKKIGISCALRNDIFTLRGTIQEGGVEYLVKGSWLFGINVVNKHPQNKIQFKDFLSRLKRIGHSE
jgi:hypothetical protein